MTRDSDVNNVSYTIFDNVSYTVFELGAGRRARLFFSGFHYSVCRKPFGPHYCLSLIHI